MKVKELFREIEEFHAALVAHRDLYGDSLNDTIPRYPIRNEEELEDQSRRLGRTAGRLRPYLERFRPQWLMRFGIGPVVDALDAATGTAHMAIIKGPSLRHVTDALNRIIGELQSLNPDDEIQSELAITSRAEGESGARRLVPETRRVLLIHGHDDANLARLADVIREHDLEPVILRKEPAKGRTLIEKFEQVAAACAFAFALMTPDDQVRVDVGRPDVRDYYDNPAVQVLRRMGQQYTQARPNVIFELGWMYGLLGRDRVCILFKRGTQIHSDLEGIERVEFNESVEEVVSTIQRELKAASLL